jgi:hypothetical protein
MWQHHPRTVQANTGQTRLLPELFSQEDSQGKRELIIREDRNPQTYIVRNVSISRLALSLQPSKVLAKAEKDETGIGIWVISASTTIDSFEGLTGPRNIVNDGVGISVVFRDTFT